MSLRLSRRSSNGNDNESLVHCSLTHPLGKDSHLDAVVGPLLPEGEHLLLGVVQERGGTRAAAVVKVRNHADLTTDACSVHFTSIVRTLPPHHTLPDQ